MRSVHVASAALFATISTLAAVGVLGNAQRVVGAGYERALAGRADSRSADVAVAENVAGSENFWLSYRADRPEIKPTVSTEVTTSLARIKQLIAAAGDLDSSNIEILQVEDVARASVADKPRFGTAMLVTARIAPIGRKPSRIVRLVVEPQAEAPAAHAL